MVNDNQNPPPGGTSAGPPQGPASTNPNPNPGPPQGPGSPNSNLTPGPSQGPGSPNSNPTPGPPQGPGSSNPNPTPGPSQGPGSSNPNPNPTPGPSQGPGSTQGQPDSHGKRHQNKSRPAAKLSRSQRRARASEKLGESYSFGIPRSEKPKREPKDNQANSNQEEASNTKPSYADKAKGKSKPEPTAHVLLYVVDSDMKPYPIEEFEQGRKAIRAEVEKCFFNDDNMEEDFTVPLPTVPSFSFINIVDKRFTIACEDQDTASWVRLKVPLIFTGYRAVNKREMTGLETFRTRVPGDYSYITPQQVTNRVIRQNYKVMVNHVTKSPYGQFSCTDLSPHPTQKRILHATFEIGGSMLDRLWNSTPKMQPRFMDTRLYLIPTRANWVYQPSQTTQQPSAATADAASDPPPTPQTGDNPPHSTPNHPGIQPPSPGASSIHLSNSVDISLNRLDIVSNPSSPSSVNTGDITLGDSDISDRTITPEEANDLLSEPMSQ